MAKKAKKKYHRKNPKRVAAGKKAARARWGKGHSKKASKKTRKHHVSVDRVEKAVEKVLSKHYTIALDGSRHQVSFPGHGHAKKVGKRKSRKPASPAQLLARARFTAMVKARAAARRGTTILSRIKKAKHGVEPRFVPYGYTGE
jgi:hypothetical protein